MKVHGLSHIGLKRANNQDRYLIRKLAEGEWLLAVADGMGGEVHGEVAAQMVVDVLAEARLERAREGQLAELLEMANRRILRMASDQPEFDGMGSTLTAALVRGSTAHWVHVGDSRFYLFRHGELSQITVDQNLAEFLYEEGELTRVEARRSPLAGILDQAMGCESLEPVMGQLEVGQGDLLMLCSDGLYGDLEPGVKTAILAGEGSLEQKCRLLVDAALEAGGRDNITVVLAQL